MHSQERGELTVLITDLAASSGQVLLVPKEKILLQ